MEKMPFIQTGVRSVLPILTAAVLCLGLSLAPLSAAAHRQEMTAPPSSDVPLLDSLIAVDFPITTDSKNAQDYFNQGLVLAYGFDHTDAEVSFLEAARLAPRAAMAFWGAAFVLGPNINGPMDDKNVPKAYELSRKALELSGRTTEKEKALIEALAKRYGPAPVADRSSLDRAFAEAMGSAYDRFPDDPDVTVIYAESLMDLHPWNYWTVGGKAQPWTPKIEMLLKKVIAAYPRHPHGHHLYIHLMENSPTPEVTIKSADMIRSLVPGSGHLVHMAGHAYYAAGFYHDCSTINEEAIEADKVLKKSFNTHGSYQIGYMPHNLHFLLASYMMEGRSRDAITTARTLSAMVDHNMMRKPGLSSLQLFYLTPYYTLVRFGKWDEVLAEPAPEADLKYPLAMWHYARGMALVRKNEIVGAEKEAAILKELAIDPELSDRKIWDLNKVTDLLAIANEVLSGEIAAAKGKDAEALAHFKRGVAIQDSLTYDEPPSWYFPVRQSLGAFLLEQGRPREAEKVFREDLLKNTENPWALYGLAQSLDAQGNAVLAVDTWQRFRRAWSRSDLDLTRAVY